MSRHLRIIGLVLMGGALVFFICLPWYSYAAGDTPTRDGTIVLDLADQRVVQGLFQIATDGMLRPVAAFEIARAIATCRDNFGVSAFPVGVSPDGDLLCFKGSEQVTEAGARQFCNLMGLTYSYRDGTKLHCVSGPKKTAL